MYEIKVLSSEEFDSVSKSDPRYEYVDDSNMGFADREKGVAYVRGSNIHDLNKYLIDHELEELESDSSTHEDPNGIRHKKFFKEFLPRFFFPALELFKPTTKVGEGIKNTLFPQSQPESPQTVTGGMEGLHMSPFNFFNPTLRKVLSSMFKYWASSFGIHITKLSLDLTAFFIKTESNSAVTFCGFTIVILCNTKFKYFSIIW